MTITALFHGGPYEGEFRSVTNFQPTPWAYTVYYRAEEEVGDDGKIEAHCYQTDTTDEEGVTYFITASLRYAGIRRVFPNQLQEEK